MSKHKSILHKYRSIFFSVVAIALLVSSPFMFGTESCDNGMEYAESSVNNSINNGSEVFQNVGLGKKLNKPFSVKNMKIAFDSMLVRANRDGMISRITSENPVKITHYYVKFKPKDKEELDRIKDDTTIHLVTYPIDHEKVPDWLSYRDPSVPIGTPTYRYTAVPIHYNFPNKVEYEILEELYLPEQDTNLVGNSVHQRLSGSDLIVVPLIRQAMYNTGNLEDNTDANARTMYWWDETFNNDWWTPSGRVMRKNADGSVVPAVGVHVKASSWFSTSDAYTNSNGNFACGSFAYSVNYYIQWDTYHFELERGNTGVTAYMAGPSGHSFQWFANIIDYNDIQWDYSQVYDASYRFYYGNRDGINASENGPWSIKVDMQVHDRSVASGNTGLCSTHRWSTNPTIDIWLSNTDANRTVDGRIYTYTVTIHELAHAGHWDRVGSSDFKNTSSAVKESWAHGVAWYITKQVYPSLEMDYSAVPNGSFGPYSGVVQDLMDTYYQDAAAYANATETLPGGTIFIQWGTLSKKSGHTPWTPVDHRYPDIPQLDRVGQPSWGCGGYNIGTVQDAILTDRGMTWNMWRDELKRRSPCNSITDDQMDELFRGWYLNQ